MKLRKNMIIGIIIIVWLVLLLSACSVNPGHPGNDDVFKIGLITPSNGIDDPYFKKIWDSLKRAEKELEAKVTYVKSEGEKDFLSKLNDLARQKCDMIFTSGTENISAILQVAEKNPGTKYINLDGTFTEPVPFNVIGIDFRTEEGAFLAGYIAGKMTNTNVLGFIMGSDNYTSQRYYYGYMAGIRYANGNECELMKGLAGTYTNKNRVQDVAERMLESGADVIFHVSGVAGKGMIKAVEEADEYAIGLDTDQNNLAPENVLTSVIRRPGDITYDIIKQFKEDKLTAGQNYSYGLKEEGVMLAESTSEQVPANIYNYLLRLQDKIINGEIEVPENEKEYLEFVDN